MSIQNRLFKTITNEFKTKEDLKQLKKYWNDCFKNFSGNQLKSSKESVFSSQIMGAKNENIMNAIMLSNNSLKEIFDMLSKNANQIFTNEYFEISSFNDITIEIPIATLVCKKEKELLKKEVVLDIFISFDEKENKIIVNNTPWFYDFKEKIWQEMPENWHHNKYNYDNIMKDYFNLELESVLLKNEIKELLIIDDYTKNNNKNIHSSYFYDYDLVKEVSVIALRDIAKTISKYTKTKGRRKTEHTSDIWDLITF
jgi:hypothetical protein